MKYVQLMERENGKIIKAEMYSVEKFIKLVMPSWIAKMFNVDNKIKELIEKDERGKKKR
jgi:hypothetical protein